MLAVLVPRPRQLVLVEDPELHTLDGTVAHGSRADPSVRRHSTGPRTGRPEAAWSPATAGLRASWPPPCTSRGSGFPATHTARSATTSPCLVLPQRERPRCPVEWRAQHRSRTQYASADL